jgi:hypothetical protein
MDITTHNATGLKVNARKGCTSGGDDYLVVSIIITKEDGLEEIAIFTENDTLPITYENESIKTSWEVSV